MSRTPHPLVGLVIAALPLLVVGCGTGKGTDVGTGPAAPGVTGTAAATTAPPGPTTSAPAGSSPGQLPGTGAGTPPGAGSPTTCVRGPATTTPFDKGGGAITCSTVPGDGTISTEAPPVTDTTIPAVTPLVPDATHGVLRGSVGGSPCPASAEQCIASYRFVPASVEARGPVRATTHTEAMAQYQLLLPPGRYQVVATSDGPDDCVPGTADVTAGQVTDLSLDCRPRS